MSYNLPVPCDRVGFQDLFPYRASPVRQVRLPVMKFSRPVRTELGEGSEAEVLPMESREATTTWEQCVAIFGIPRLPL